MRLASGDCRVVPGSVPSGSDAKEAGCKSLSNFTGVEESIEVKCGFPRHLLPRVWSWIEPHRAKLFDDFGPQDITEFMAQWDYPAILAASWQVTIDGSVGGIVRLSECRRGVMQMQPYFPQRTFKPVVIATALEQTIQQAFAATPEARKIEWRGFEGGANLIGAIRRIGGSREALIQRGALQGGRWVPVVQMGVLREEVI